MKIINRIEAIHKLNNGKPLIFQTDTLPAIGCKPEYSEIIYKIKRRNKEKALILMGSEISQVLKYVHPAAKGDFLKTAEEFWPGALTMVVPISEENCFNFISKTNTIGIRVPNSLDAQLLISRTGPLSTSSANISGISTAITAKEVACDLPNVDILGPIPWKKCSGLGSTIISWSSKGSWKLIREGQVAISKLK